MKQQASYLHSSLWGRLGGALIGLAVSTYAHCQSSFKPGETWNDTGGSAINAHGGCVQYWDGTYYWFGETRSGSTSNGVSCYSSTDLLKWKKLSNAFTPTGTKGDNNDDVAQGRLFERPKVIYNEKTGKWVMWAHWENGKDYGQAKVAVFTADKVTGPYKVTENGVFRPNGHDSRDQTLFLDPNTGDAYHVSATETNYRTHFVKLSEDFTKPTDEETLEVLGARYEAASMFSYGETYWCLFSGCDGWNPNRGRFSWNNNPLENWSYGRDFYANNSYGRDFCVDNGNLKCYTSQPAYVFPVQGRDRCFIYMGDRWNSSNVGSSKYVWLPLSIRSGYPAVRWYDSWNLSVFDHMNDKRRVARIEEGTEAYLLEKYSDRILSRPTNSFKLQDDDASNTCFVFHTTDDPYIFKLEIKGQDKWLESVYGSARLSSENDKDSQKWRFVLEEDGYYKIVNVNDGYAFSVSGNGTQAGTAVALLEQSNDIHQSFAVYYDITEHPEYKEADMFAADYRAKNRILMEEQALHTGIHSATPTLSDVKEVSYYSLSGTLLSSKPATPGTYVVRYTLRDGSVLCRKVTNNR